MNTLRDAWDWYEAARVSLARLQRIGRRHWDGLPAGVTVWRDDEFKQLASETIEAETERALRPLEDLAVLVLFSVFESAVRRHLSDAVGDAVDRGATGPGHAVVVHAADAAIEGIRQHSFTRNVLEPLKQQGLVQTGLAEEVRQVREYRNWVGHGRGADRPANVTPRDAYDRLRRFLDALGIPTEPAPTLPEADPA